MPSSAGKDFDKHTPNLWKEAYSALDDDEKGNARLKKLTDILKKELDTPSLKLRSEAGYQQLQGLISSQSQKLASSKLSTKAGMICDTMLKIQDLVAAGANVGGPYVAIPAAALFLAFSFKQIYDSDKQSMFELASKVADYTLLHAKSSNLIKDMPGDDEHTQTLRQNLHIMYIGLYKAIMFATAQLTICLYGGSSQIIRHLFKSYDWEGQMKELDDQEKRCDRLRNEIFAPCNKPDAIQEEEQKPLKIEQKKYVAANPSKQRQNMGPAPRNPLHWAAALGVPEQVTYLVQKNEYPINALTPRKWTASHLAARQGNTKIMRTLLTAPGVDLRITNEEGHTPLHIATMYNRVGAVKLLLQRDHWLLGRWDTKGATAFSLAASRGHVLVLAALREHGQNFNEVTTKNGWTALHLAAENGHLEAVKYLLANGARKETRLKAGIRAGYTARQIAELSRKLEIVAIL